MSICGQSDMDVVLYAGRCIDRLKTNQYLNVLLLGVSRRDRKQACRLQGECSARCHLAMCAGERPKPAP